eukprot:GFUD01045583.1.p1 GENE.GFUD01045583.1~~GFUD01045583.1.p1  ORF type:complete len:946 (-),score=177.76 GFUD01045583.1:160-2622(-)
MDKGKSMLDKGKSDDSTTTDDFYDYYDLDYGDSSEYDVVGDFLSDLDPDFLKNISPTLIIAYFESASPDDIKAILDNSKILLNLPPETIGQLLQKLPKELLIQVVNSEGVKSLFSNTDLNAEELEKVQKFQADVASILLEKLDLDVIASLPDFLVKSQLENKKALATLLKFPDKLEALFNAYPNLINEVPPSTALSLLQDDPEVFTKLPPAIFSKLFTCDLVSELGDKVDPTVLISIGPEQLVTTLNAKPDILKCIPKSLLDSLMQIINLLPASDLASIFLELPLEQLSSEVIQSVPDEILKELWSNPDLISNINEDLIDKFSPLIDKFSIHQIKLLLEELPIEQLSPEVIQSVPDEILIELGSNPDLISNINEDLIVKFSPLIDKFSIHQIKLLLEEVPIEQLSPEVIQSVPDEILIELGSNPDLISNISEDLIVKFSPLIDKFSIHQIKLLLEEVPIEQLSPELIQSVPDEILIELGSNPDLISNINEDLIVKFSPLIDKFSIHQIKLLLAHGFLSQPNILEKLPISSFSKFAANLELLSLVPDSALNSLVTLHPDLIASMPASSLAHIAKTRPWLIGMFPLSAVASLSSRQDVLALLSDQDLVNLMAFQPALLNIVAEFPADLLLKFMQSRIGVLDSLPQAAEPYLAQLLVSEKFISKLPATFLASLTSNRGIRKYLTKFALINILRVHPSLPTLVPPEDFLPFMEYLNDPWFRLRIPCLTISLMSKNPGIINSLPASVLESVITSRRFLSCIPADNLKNLMGMRLGLSRLPMLAMLRSARQLPSDKYSLGLVYNFLREQAPELGSSLVHGRLRLVK